MMKTPLITTAFFITFASASAFAHHPAADIVNPEIYAMIDENVADTPHADLVFDDMGGSMNSAGTDTAEVDAGAARFEGRVDVDVALSADEAIDTMALYGDVVNALAE